MLWNKNKSTLPELLRLTDTGLREQLEAMPASQALIGLGADGQPVSVDWDTESPHVLVCSASGGGTSTTLRTLAAQLLHHGAHTVVLDPKRISQTWARGVDNVTYCRDIETIHDALVGLRTELQRRTAHIDQYGECDDLPRLTVLLEVAHHTLRQLTRYWDKVRQANDPKASPAVDALHELLFAGRGARMHVLFGGQSDTTPLGAVVREQFSTVVLGRVTTRTWGRLAPQIHPAPKGSTRPGRVHVVQGATAHPTQVLLMTDTEAADWAAATAAEKI
ncbi:FtsK/SpoIIIE domain-containing protein [Streptomyces sp. NPDC048219]|uniref:FtsK/SpoIIIE domain-containing protein n=1 Tax=Streptomyces sp. NPDC048219 TaxID=3365517 RepID=UPI00371D4239